MKSKKLLLGSLSTMALVATPIAAVVSCDNGKTAEAAGDKKAAFNAADLIKKIGKDDKGLVVALPMGSFYVSAENAKKASTLPFMGNTLAFPALDVKANSHGKVTLTMSEENFKAHQDKVAKEAKDKLKISNPSATAAELTAAGATAVAKAKKTMDFPITTVANVTEGQFIVNKHMVKANAADVATFLKDELTVTEGKEGLYPFAFKKDPADALKPELTVESKTAFDKIFTDLGLQVTALEFAKAKDSTKITVAKLTITKKTTPVVAKGSVQGDLTALGAAIPATTATATTTVANGVIAAKAKAEIKPEGAAMTGDQLVAKINEFIKAGTTFLTKPTTLLNTLIKDDMVISAEIKTPTATASNGSLELTFSKSGLTDVTTTIIITK